MLEYIDVIEFVSGIGFEFGFFFFFFFYKIALCLYRVLHCTIATYYIMHLGIYRSASVPSTYVSVPRPTVV